MLTLLLELLGELLVQLLAELLAVCLPELFLSWRKSQAPAWLKTISYAFWGVLLGLLSLYFFPTLLIPQGFALANLLLTPLLMGVVFVALSKAKSETDDWLQKARFVQGFFFAFGFALVRYVVL